MGSRLKNIALAGLIAAMYATLSLVFAPISFGVYQIRIAEALTVLPFLTAAGVPGLFVGCVIANVFGGVGWQDIVFGSLLTLAAAVLTRLIYHLSYKKGNRLLALAPLACLWGGGIALLGVQQSYPISIICLALSIWLLVYSSRQGKEALPGDFRVHGSRILSFTLILVPLYLSRDFPHWSALLLGGLCLFGAWVATWGLAFIWLRGLNPNVMLAPLPPVLLNAFGVSVYLAPIAGVNYWFCVQMVGVGELIACYLIGLPLLLLLHRRRGYFFN
ncbi:MAG TPA: QueT transporter family protein [Candidatus Acidoferrum sp.]|nr:QueT transporter family protein [Candidatus Acidoferrum sp.]